MNLRTRKSLAELKDSQLSSRLHFRGKRGAAFRRALLLRRLQLYCNVDKGQRGPAQGLIFAEDQRQVAFDLRVAERDGGQHARLHVLYNVGAPDESNSYISR